MFNKNVFTQKDPIADLVKPMLEAQAQAKMEELKGQQHKIDKNKNNKIDAHDFAILRGEKKAMKEEEQVEEGWDDMMKAAKERRGPQPSGDAGVKKGRAYGGAAQKSKPEQDDADDKKMKKEEVEAQALVENVEMINEVSLGAKIKAYAHHSRNAFDHHDMGNDEEGEHHAERADKIIAHIARHHGPEAVKHAEKAAHSAIFGRDDPHGHGDGGKDVLHGGLRGSQHDFSGLSKKTTKAGVIPKSTQKAMKNKIMAYGRHRNIAGPKGHLPEEVQIDERTLTPGETAEKERIVKGMKKNLAGFKSRYGEKAKSVMDAMQGAHERNVGAKPTSEEVESKSKKNDDIPFEGPYTKKKSATPGKYGQGYSTARHLARQGMKKAEKQMKEDVEHIEERSLTSGETAEKERIVKGMKKNLAGFKARYGERAKSVMYATATKAAKKD